MNTACRIERQSPLTTRSRGRFPSDSRIAACHFPGKVLEGRGFEQRLMELTAKTLGARDWWARGGVDLGRQEV